MKNKYLHLLILLLVFKMAVAQQVPREEVLLEGFTGTWCSVCPGASMGAEDLILNGHDVVVIEYHINDVFETPNALARQYYYYVNALPTVYFDGIIEHVGGNPNSTLYTTYLPLYEERIAIMSDFSIDIDGANSQLTDYVVNVNVEKVAENNSQNLALIFALTETDIPYLWMGQDYIKYCERFMLPDANGTSLDFSASDNLDFTYSFSLNPEWVPENLELVVWIQDLSSKEVHQAAKRSLSEFGDFPTLDAMVKNIYTPVSLCSDAIEPGVEVVNLGAADLTSLDFVYQIDNEPEQIYSWTGNIPFSESDIISLPEIELSISDLSTFLVNIENPNGQLDQFPYNDTLTSIIQPAENVSSPVTLVLKLDNYPDQSSWELSNSDGDVLYSGGNYSEPGVFVTESFNLDNIDCYSFKIYDSNGDGLTGTGLYKLMYGNTIFQTGKEFGYMDEAQFGIGLVQTPDQNSESTIHVYPNPANDVLYINCSSGGIIEILNLHGQLIMEINFVDGFNAIDISDIPNGVYIMNNTTNNRFQNNYRLIIQ